MTHVSMDHLEMLNEVTAVITQLKNLEETTTKIVIGLFRVNEWNRVHSS
jgi:hypothetical protein